ncbi:MAG: HAD-IA family hydrolase, partial [Miltoncostaeaceae bacterium]
MCTSQKPAVIPDGTEVVLIDAYGTLIGLEPPVPRLRAALAAAGHPHDEADVAAAFVAEVSHYREHHLRAGTPDGLAALRLECAQVMARRLGPGAPPVSAVAGILLDGLRFHLYPDALPALEGLRARGLRLALVSNWDMALGDILVDLGIAGLFETVVISAVCGLAKPDPAIYAHALDRLGVTPGRAVHVGDDPLLDGEGARAAGLRAILIDRGAGPG